MKKFFTIAALAAAMCGAAQAQETVSAIYIAGADGTEINGQVLGNWDIVNTLEVKPERGKFVLTIKNFSAIAISDMKLEEESWGTWNDHLWSYPGTADMTDADLDKAFPMSGPGQDNGAGNVAAPWTAEVWEVEIAGDLSTITYRTSTPKPADVVHLLGNDPIGWNTKDEYQFENEAGTNVYWLDIPEERAIVGPHVNLNIIVNGDWNIWWGGATKPLVFDEPQMWGWKANVGTDNDYVIPDGTSYWGTIRFVRPAAGEPAEVTMYTEIVPHKSEPAPDVVHLVGNDPIGWSTRDEYQFENEAGTNVWWLDIPKERAIVGPHVNLNIIVNGDWEIWWGAATKPLVFNEPQMWGWKTNVGTDNDYVMPYGTSYWGTIRFVRPAAGEPAEVTMYTKIVPHKSEPVADVVHLVGDDPIGWNMRDEYQFENEAGTDVWWLDIPKERAIVGPHVNLGIIVNGDRETWWGAATKPLVFDEPQMWGWKTHIGTDNDYVMPVGTSYWGTIRFVRPADGEPAEVTMYTEIVPHKTETVSTGIETVLTDEDATPEYFTLQGLRVGSPQQGQIYIVRQGSKVSKVYYR